MTRSKNTTFVSMCLTNEEKRLLDEAAAESGFCRNRFIRNWILSLRPKA